MMKKIHMKWMFIIPIIFLTLIIGFYMHYSNNKISKAEQGMLLYNECHSRYMDKYNELTEGINQTNAREKIPLLYNDTNKILIEEMGNILNEYDEKLADYRDDYIAYHEFSKLYKSLKTHFYQLEKYDELSGFEKTTN